MMKAILSLIFLILIINAFAKHQRQGTSFENNSSEEDSEEKLKVPHLKFTVYSSLKYNVVSNNLTKTLVLLDYLKDLSYFFNGKTGEVFVFRYETGEISYIPNGLSGKTWLSSKQSFHEYLKNKGSLKGLFTIGETQGISFQVDCAEKDYIKKMRKMVASLSPYYGSRCDVFDIFLHISRMTSVGLKSSLSGYFKVVGDVSTEMRGDLRWIYAVFQGMGNFFSAFKEGLNALIEKNIRFDLKQIVTKTTGIHVLIYFLEILSKQFDLKIILNNTLEIQEHFFSLVDGLSGGSSDDFGGLLHVFAEILKLNGKNSKQNIYIALREYFKNAATADKEIGKQWLSSIQDLLKTLNRLKLQDSFPNLAKLLNDILEEKWTCNGINMSQVVKKILTSKDGGDDMSIQAILRLLKKEDSPKN